MKIRFPVTVISDTHIGHTASLVRDPQQLAPLFADSKTVVFNGDTVEMLWRHNRTRAREQLRRVAGCCRREGARPIFVSGNHDPFVSPLHHLDVWDRSVLLTHGDILFHEVAPWSRDAEILGPERSRILSAMGEDALTDLERQLLASKCASLALEMREPPSPGGWLPKLTMAVRETWPPWRVLRILSFWAQTPGRADALARAFRPEARFVFIGHTHHPGIWEIDGRVIINTGAFLPFSGRLAVRIDEAEIRVHRVIRTAGVFRLGPLLRQFARESAGAIATEERSAAEASAAPGR